MLHRKRLEADMREEMQLHFEHRAAEHFAAGLSLDESRRQASVEFGSRALFEEEARGARGWTWFDHIRRDFLFARRQLGRSPLFCMLTVGTISICLGLNAAVFSVLSRLVIHPLPFSGANRMVEIFNTFPKVNIPKFSSNIGQYTDFKENLSACETVALCEDGDAGVNETDRTVRVSCIKVTAEFFDLLALRPLHGGFFSKENQIVGADKVVVLTKAYWTSKFGRDPKIIGQTLRINGESYEIVGVAPGSFAGFDAGIKIILPFSWEPSQSKARSGFSPQLFARLRPGFSLAQASAQANALERRYYDTASVMARSFIDHTGQTVQVDALQHQRGLPFEKPIFLLQGAMLILLLVACANVLNLFLARASSRDTEFGVRAALGASATDLVRQLSVEATAVGLLGTIGGMFLACGALRAVNGFSSSVFDRFVPFSMGVREWATLVAAGVGLTALIASVTALRALSATYRSNRFEWGGRSQSATRGSRRFAGVLVVCQISLSFIVSVTAVLLVLSFMKAVSVPLGLNPERLIAMRIDLSVTREKNLPRRIEEALKAIPGMESCVASATPFYLIPPYNYSMPLGVVNIRGKEPASGESLPSVFYCGVTANYARILGLKLLQGRWFSDTEYETGRYVVIDEAFRLRHFPGEDPIGKQLVVNRAPPTDVSDWQEVIGVVADVPHNGVEEGSRHPFVYLSREYTPLFGSASILAKTNRSPEEAIPLIRKAIAELDPDVPIYAENTLLSVIADSLQQRRNLMKLLLIIAGVSLFLSGLGIYGTMAYDIFRRTREIGIRMAVGATARSIISMLLRDNGARAFAGLAGGAGAAVFLNHYIAGILFETSPTNVIAYIIAAGIVCAACIISSWIPARCASRIDPASALRAE